MVGPEGGRDTWHHCRGASTINQQGHNNKLRANKAMDLSSICHLNGMSSNGLTDKSNGQDGRDQSSVNLLARSKHACVA